MSAVLNILSNSLMTTFALIGAGTLINKVGVFLKTYEDEKQDSYKRAFDKTVVTSMEDINFCVDSVKRIMGSTTKAGSLVSEIMLGSKVIQKDKTGRIYISDKSKVYNQYEDTISQLNMKVQKYQEELEKMKKVQGLTKKNIDMKIKKKYEDDEHEHKIELSDMDESGDEFVLENNK